jgi:hypothetical protein
MAKLLRLTFFLLLFTASAQANAPSTLGDIKLLFSALTNKQASYQFSDIDKLHSDNQIDISNVYPNPASQSASFDYVLLNPSVEAKITIRNVLGNVVAERLLDVHQQTVSININHLVTGIYFYTLSLDGKNIVTKKLIVKR